MKYNLLFAALIGLMMLNFSSCDKCRGLLGKAKVECSNGGTCNDGACDCLKGYTGATCDSIDICELKDVFCDHGVCVDGVCNCSPGFESEDCSVWSAQKYLGTYQIIERCNKLDTFSGHKITISQDLLDPSIMKITNLFNYNQFSINGFYSKINAKPLANTTNFQIPSQAPDGTEKRIQGNGTINIIDSNNITLSIDYTITNGNKTYDCNVQATYIP